MDPALEIELGEDVADVAIDDELADDQLIDNLAVAASVGDEVEDLPSSPGERFRKGRVVLGGAAIG